MGYDRPDLYSQPLRHHVTAIPIMKMDADGPIGYKWSCSCGRSTAGRHNTAEKAVEAGQDHIK